ncbi:hypothetical protein [Roseimicrobium sp. ORNL1]|uniref:hypothetical protein n=1 Tax=Roseimicrobium sp. ORNL1 TaxID=2711231 RepID=UPI0013E1216C|nr:hypothetical protein [Roseimicrobium sp. ORNL1]QIF00380.1 hypothetical protein G5S37_02175 [Roseimicrobium sp. ORNL1]
MKTKLMTLALALIAGVAFGHGGVELGPKGGRLLELSKDESMHAEVLVKDGKFHLTLLDKDLKPVKVTEQTITATTGDRKSPEKLEVAKTDTGFTVPVVKDGAWLIVQFKATPKAKPITARMEYDTGECSECKSPEWLCKCKEEKK